MSGHVGCVGATLYVTAGSGNSFKPALALAQLGISHQLRFVDVLAGGTRTQEFLAINRAGQVPYLVDAHGFGLSESNAMLMYIADQSDLIPESARDKALMMQWMFFEQTRLEPNISPARFYTAIQPHREHEFALEIPLWREKAYKALSLLDVHLSTSNFIVENHGYSIGDIGVFGYVHLAGDAGLDLSRFEHVSQWIKRVTDTPGFTPIHILLNPTATLASAGSAAQRLEHEVRSVLN